MLLSEKQKLRQSERKTSIQYNSYGKVHYHERFFLVVFFYFRLLDFKREHLMHVASLIQYLLTLFHHHTVVFYQFLSTSMIEHFFFHEYLYE